MFNYGNVPIGGEVEVKCDLRAELSEIVTNVLIIKSLTSNSSVLPVYKGMKPAGAKLN